jgi:oligopeptidase B
MKILGLVFVTVMFLLSCGPASEPAGQVGAAQTDQASLESPTIMINQPMPKKRPHEMTLHGITRIDEYYWLRDDTRKDPEVLAYLEAENAYFDKVMEPYAAMQQTIYEEMTGRLDPDDSSVPYFRDGYWYYSRYEPGQEFAIHARRKGDMDAAEEILVDGNQRARNSEFYRLWNVEVSDDHRYVAIAEDFTGRRIDDIRILDTQNGTFLPEVIGNAEDSLAFSADGQYLFYLNKHPETLLGYQLMRHKLGTAPEQDVLVYEEADNTFYNAVWRSRSGDFIFLMHESTETTEVQLLAAADPLGNFRPFLPRETGHEYEIDHANGRFFIRTNWQADNFRVMQTDLEHAGDKTHWREVIPNREDAMVQSIEAFDRWLVVGERKDGLRRVRVVALDGSMDRYLEGAETASVMWPDINVNTDTDTIRYGFSSLVTPQQIWEIDLKTGASRLLKAERVLGGFSSDDYHSDRIVIDARDGVGVPVSFAYRKDTKLDGTAPALIYAYGSYGISTDPWFRSSVISLLDRGFVFVLAHVRGGEELGRSWYENGRQMKKMNTFNDFIDVTRALQKMPMIDPARTFAMGGSAGGLLMGAVANMAPELYLGIIAAVPFVDVVTTMLDESIPLTTGEFDEWGNPKNRDAFEYMLSYSPYDQVKAQDYPNIMVTTGLYDSQVQYFEPAKWVARLRDRRTDSNKLILRTNMDAGHGGVQGRYRSYEETAREYAFLVGLAGLER